MSSRELGAEEVIDYCNPNDVDAIEKAAGEEGLFAAYKTVRTIFEECIGACRRERGASTSNQGFELTD
jgi:hypothetical protein